MPDPTKAYMFAWKAKVDSIRVDSKRVPLVTCCRATVPLYKCKARPSLVLWMTKLSSLSSPSSETEKLTDREGREGAHRNVTRRSKVYYF